MPKFPANGHVPRIGGLPPEARAAGGGDRPAAGQRFALRGWRPATPAVANSGIASRRRAYVLVGVAACLLSGVACPPPALADSVFTVSTGSDHTCAVTLAGGVRCWGRNSSGQLGDGTKTTRTTAVAVSGLAGGVEAIATGYGHTCALTGAGGVHCWGLNGSGQLGDGTKTNRTTPVTVSGLTGRVVAVVTGYGHTCALTEAGGVSCWGLNSSGQLGAGSTTIRMTPTWVSGFANGAAGISAGYSHTCAVTTSGGVQCWGDNSHGQLGDGTTSTRRRPVAVSGLSTGAGAVRGGFAHSCAVKTSGAIRCWGRNSSGQLGDGSTAVRKTPASVTGLSSEGAAVSAGYYHTCAVKMSGAVRCWGWNASGQLGDFTTSDSMTPVAVSGLSSGAIEVSGGGRHSCAVTATGSVKCWGYNGYGQLGDGTTTTRTTPVRVSGLP